MKIGMMISDLLGETLDFIKAIGVNHICATDYRHSGYEELGYWDPRPWHEEMPLRPKRWPKDTWRSQWGFGSNGQGFDGHV